MTDTNFEPRIIAFLCNWCTYTGADLAGTSRLQYPPNVRIIRLMCSGAVDPIYVLKADLAGADGILIGGCHPGDCHYQEGNYKARRRVVALKEILKNAGFDDERVWLRWISASEGSRFADTIREMTTAMKELGPNPTKEAWAVKPRQVKGIMETIITVENGNTLAALQGFFKQLLQHGIVDALVAPLRTPSGTITPALVTKTDLLDAADPLSPVLPGNSATLAGKLSVREPRARIGVVLRSCEIRALVELVKMQQASLESVTLIAVDCAGTYHVPVYLKMAQKGDTLWQELYQNAAGQPEKTDEALRAACKICEQPVYDSAEIKIKLLGSDLNQEIHVELPDEMAAQLGLSPAAANGRQAVVDKLIATRTSSRDAVFGEMRARLEGEEGIAGVFAACIRCHNCMTVCPICYCKVCVFKSPVFDHEPMQFMEWAKQKGAYRLPSDTMLFHLTRLNHMGLSCVGCGMCTEACPAELPVGIVFRAIGQRLQAAFDYAPGRNKDEQLPLVTFKADEWTEVGE